MDSKQPIPARARRPRGAIIAIGVGLLAVVGTQPASARYGDFSRDMVVRTDKRFGHDCFWQGPRGLEYANLPDPTPIQKANLYPDGKATYWVANFEDLPRGTRIKLAGQYPRSRYMSFAIVKVQPNGSAVSTDEHTADIDVVPNRGSRNPFVRGADRQRGGRRYDFFIVADDPPLPPAVRPANTLYLGASGSGSLIYRVVLPDEGLDGAGGVPLPRSSAVQADGRSVSSQRLCRELVTPLTEPTPPGVSLATWLALRAMPYANPPFNDPATMPAFDPPRWEKFWNGTYSIAGLFVPPEERAALPLNSTDLAANKDTTFLMSFLSRQYGPVFVVRGKMPLFPDTYRRARTMQDHQERYWSLCQNDAPPSGKAYQCVTDFQVPLDDERNYTVVISRLADRPTNATENCGVSWLDWGDAGEGIPEPDNRSDFGLAIMRFEFENPDFANGGQKIVAAGTEAAVMGPYFPRGEYATKDAFEARGCPVSG